MSKETQLIDEYLGEKVMGWGVSHSQKISTFRIPHEGGGSTLEPCCFWTPTINIASAIEVLEKFVGDNPGSSYRIFRHTWPIRYASRCVVIKTPTRRESGRGENLPLLICETLTDLIRKE